MKTGGLNQFRNAELIVTLISASVAAVAALALGVHRHIGLFNGTACLHAPALELYELDIRLDDGALTSLLNAPRQDVEGLLSIKNSKAVPVRIHLKGKGSFQPINKKPNFTCKPMLVRQGMPAPIGSRKFHLHSSSQDPSLLADFFARKIYRRLGIAVGEMAFASVRLNGTSIGPYAVTQGINRDFLETHYGMSSGELLEGEEFQDTIGVAAHENGPTCAHQK